MNKFGELIVALKNAENRCRILNQELEDFKQIHKDDTPLYVKISNMQSGNSAIWNVIIKTLKITNNINSDIILKIEGIYRFFDDLGCTRDKQ